MYYGQCCSSGLIFFIINKFFIFYDLYTWVAETYLKSALSVLVLFIL